MCLVLLILKVCAALPPPERARMGEHRWLSIANRWPALIPIPPLARY